MLHGGAACRSPVLEGALMRIDLDIHLAKMRRRTCVQHHCLSWTHRSRRLGPGSRLCRMQATSNPEHTGSRSASLQQLNLTAQVKLSLGSTH